jgi:phosphoribosylamine---glycine ligase
MNILIIGSGGREHALAWSVGRSPLVTTLYCAPGNPGTAAVAENVPIEATDIDALIAFAKEKQVGLTIVGPEQPLTGGIVGRFQAEGLDIFGPTRDAAELEWSKTFAKRFMKEHGIPTAEFRTFSAGDYFDAARYIDENPVPVVIKADGLAAGKGVIICETKEEALETLDLLLRKKSLGEAGQKVVVEEFLVGEEASVFAITDGKDYVLLPAAQDHKRIFDNDLGRNTGGMGAYAPAPVVTERVLELVKRTIIRPTLLGMNAAGRPYRGCLYVGLMVTETGPKVVEYNCRFGDPETQVVIPLADDDLVPFFQGSARGKLPKTRLKFRDCSAVCVVLASGGYPGTYESGKVITGSEFVRRGDEIMVFHAGTRRTPAGLVTAGGRVLGVTAVGPSTDLQRTINRAYNALEKITFDGAYYRSDIGKKGVERLRSMEQKGME